jgi:aquaporin Z
MAIRACLTEFIGTFFLVFTIGMVIRGGTTDEPLLLAPLAIGGVLMVMVYMGGHISGGHYNPAVSLAVMLRGKLSGTNLTLYWIAQVLGAIAAALMVYCILSRTFAPTPAPAYGVARALLVEFIFTFALALVVLNTATAPRTEGNSYFGLAIGCTIVVGVLAGGGISGGAYNPAVAVGPALIDVLLGGGTLRHLWIYLVAPLAGGVAAAAVFRFQNPPDLA